MTAARNLSRVVGTLVQQGLNKPNANPIVINGNLQNNQYETNNTLTGLGDGDEGYVIHDRLRHTLDAGAGRYTAANLAITDLPGFSQCLHLTCTTAEASLATAGSIFSLDYRVEAFDIASLLNWSDTSNDTSAKYITVSFYMKTNKAFKFTTGFINSDHSRHIRKEFTTSTSWTRHVLTFAPDIGNSPNSDFGEGLRWRTTISAGSNYTSGTLATDWEANTTANMHTSNTPNNFFDSTDNDIKITGLQIEIGQYTSDTIPDFQPTDIGIDKMRCHRYCQSQVDGADQLLGYVNAYNNDNVNVGGYHFGVFRTTPSLIQNGGTDSFKVNSEAATRGAFDDMTYTEKGHTGGIVIGATGTNLGYQGSTGYIWTNSTARLLVSAEL
tara:strand:+ start:163 stop:1311 length:1149 start_codon:yes stop_codon:yes gene_type:complete